MNVDQRLLDRTAAACWNLESALATMKRKAARSGANQLAGELEDLRARSWYAAKDLIEAGAANPGDAVTDRPASARPTETPLELLDTPANRELLRCLLLTRDAALAVDKERGHEGDGFADVIEHFAANVANEVHGPADVRQGAKE